MENNIKQTEKIITAFENIPHVLSENIGELKDARNFIFSNAQKMFSFASGSVITGLDEIISAYEEWQKVSRELSPNNM